MINTIQALRFFAAFFVVLHHAARSFPVDFLGSVSKVIQVNFAFGVDIFFVISGYVIYSSFIRNPKTSSQFIQDRVIRIAPMYWLYTFLFLVVIFSLPTPFTTGAYEINNLLSSLLFIPYSNPMGGFFPTLPVGWTLNFEMVFYAIFAASVLIKSKNIPVFLLVSIILLNALSSLGVAHSFYSDSIIYEFSLGVLIGYLHRNSSLLESKGAAIPTAIIFLMLLIMCGSDESQRFVKWGIPAAIIVSCCISINNMVRVPKIFVILGNASYSLYLSHKVIMAALIYFVMNRFISFEQAFYLSVFFSVLISVASYQYIEKPITKFLKSIRTGNGKVPV
ncbi:acyltransferase family protein [Enterobacter hormaechei]|uniref:acyltransferase family protein n=1 Tax=Enterobacter hormaechei TaxID=158836 RepID=UPI000797A9DC|nr:acyltransferase [Enterobacter hormaechei]CZY58036.1 acyltransferase 3 [Enterobacter hormaechei]CZY64301.1 acyltransferase 3 [Enterobacter hormaechei]CZY73434.1 acyltransferase 3 [Enterobacter hormaechei]SAF35832.1 acyltransferase 3 [Enterobacter hormaechei]